MKTPYIPYVKEFQPSPIREIFKRASKDAINLGLGQPGEDTPAFIRKAAQAKLESAALGYTPNAGLYSLREKLADRLTGEITPEQVCVTAGVQQALFTLFYILFDETSRVLLPDPGFLTYPILGRLNQSVLDYYPLRAENDFEFKAEDIIEQVQPDTQAVLLSHPSNPAGSIAEPQEIKKLVDFAANRKEGPLWLIADEIYLGMHFRECGYLSQYWDEYPYMIIAGGASKTHHMTGWRMGWAYLPEKLAPIYFPAHQYITVCASVVSQLAFDAICGTREEAEWLKYQRNLYLEKSRLVFEKLAPVRKVIGGDGAFYALLRLNDSDLQQGDDVYWAHKFAREYDVLTIPGSAFGNNTKGYLRLSFGARKAELEQGLDRIVSAFS